MIKTIADVQSMLLKGAELFNDPVFKRRFLMDSPGLSKERVSVLKEKYHNFPESYINVILDYKVNGIDVDAFDLSPYFNSNPDIVIDLIDAQEDSFFPKEFMRKHKMYQIGSCNTDILCVTEGTDQFSEGEILYIDEGYDIYNPEDSQIHPIAKDFEQFIILAGNLEQIHSELGLDDCNYEKTKNEFLNRLRTLGVDKKYDQAWLRVC